MLLLSNAIWVTVVGAIGLVPTPHVALEHALAKAIRADLSRSRPVVITEFPSLNRVVLTPSEVRRAYLTNPRGTVALLYRVVRDGTALESVTAAGYAIGLMDRPAVGSVCAQIYKGAEDYDTVHPAWRLIVREHRLSSLRQDCVRCFGSAESE